MTRDTVGAIVLIWICASVYPAFAQDDPTGGVARARTLLSASDTAQLRKNINELYQLPQDDRLTDFYRKVWNLDRAAYPELAWAALSRPEVRITYAQLWGQHLRYATGNRKMRRDPSASRQEWFVEAVARAPPRSRRARFMKPCLARCVSDDRLQRRCPPSRRGRYSKSSSPKWSKTG